MPWAIAVLALLFVPLVPAVPTFAQQGAEEDEEDTGRRYTLIVEASTWVAQAAGLQMFAASAEDPNSVFGTRLLGSNHGTESEGYFRAGFALRRNLGKVMFTWYEHGEDELSVVRSRPGDFTFGQILSHPLFAGVNNDGRADAFDAAMTTDLSELRIDFYRTAFETARVRGEWFVGVRRTVHDRSTTATYRHLVPGFTPFLPPLTSGAFGNLTPLPDTAAVISEYEGRGFEGGMNFTAPLLKSGKLSFEGGFAVAATRGKTDAAYRSTTHYYVLDQLTGGEVIIAPPYAEFEDTFLDPMGIEIPLATRISQRTLNVGQFNNSISTSGTMVEVNLGLRWKINRQLNAFLGFRNTHYSNVAIDLRPVGNSAPTASVIDGELIGVNVDNFRQENGDATYEGFYLGLGFRR